MAEGGALTVEKEWPETVDEAVRVVLDALSEDEQTQLAALPEGRLFELHFGLGMWIRNHLGLWSGNRRLLEASGERHPDDASMVITVAVWRRLQEDVPKVH